MKNTNNMKKPTIFVTYNWNDASDLFILNLKSNLKGVEMKYDKVEIDCWDSITNFMNTIGQEDFVVQILSDKYLKSANCLYEVMQLMNSPNWTAKTMTVVMNDATDIYDPIKRLEYIQYWSDETEKYRNQLSSLPDSATVDVKEVLLKYEAIRDNIGKFLMIAADRSNPKVLDAVDAIKKKIKPVQKKKKKSNKNQAISAKTKSLLTSLWAKIVPLYRDISTIMIIKHDPQRLEAIKQYRNEADALKTAFDVIKPQLKKDVRDKIQNFIATIKDFYDAAVWVCSLEKTSKTLQGDPLIRYTSAIMDTSSKMEQMSKFIDGYYLKFENCICGND